MNNTAVNLLNVLNTALLKMLSLSPSIPQSPFHCLFSFHNFGHLFAYYVYNLLRYDVYPSLTAPSTLHYNLHEDRNFYLFCSLQTPCV